MRPFANKTGRVIISDISTGYFEYIEFIIYRRIKGPVLLINMWH